MRINSLDFFARRRRRTTRTESSNEDYSWIWEPFKEAKDSKVAQAACSIAKSIANSSPDKIPKNKLKVDPRIAIPLCAIVLQNDLNNLDQVNIQETSSREDAVNHFLKITKPSPLWRYLFNSLSAELQYQLCYRLSNHRLPTKNDWRNLFKKNSYRFNISLDYAFILAILLVISLIAIIGMYYFITLDIDRFINIFVIWSFITLFAFWFYWGKQNFDFTSLENINNNNDLINLIAILAFLVFILGILFEMFRLIGNTISNSNLFLLSTIIFFIVGFC